jgi:alpha-tubulin suppressor-like RCC1 family protein
MVGMMKVYFPELPLHLNRMLTLPSLRQVPRRRWRALRSMIYIGLIPVLAACEKSPVGLGRDGPWESIAAGGGVTCGLSAGIAYCWGGHAGLWRTSPQPTDSTIPNFGVPTRVPGENRFVQITVGSDVRCALDREGAAYCWGPNILGENGDGSRVAKTAATPVLGGHRWSTISAGAGRVCGVTLEREAYCWGNGFRGTLGNGSMEGASAVPLRVLGGHEFKTVAVGLATACALTMVGEAYCWGVGSNGILGDGNDPDPHAGDSSTPSRVVGGYRFSSLTVGYFHVCTLTEVGEAYCWGSGLVRGDGSMSHTSWPARVGAELRFSQLSAGAYHTCGVTTDRRTFCWGRGENGRLGTHDTNESAVPTRAHPGVRYSRVVAAYGHTCGLTSIGSAYCWGDGEYGQLGDGAYRESFSPVPVAR